MSRFFLLIHVRLLTGKMFINVIKINTWPNNYILVPFDLS